MSFKPRHRYVVYPGIDFKNHDYTGTVWRVAGKTEEYEVEMLPHGLMCTCPGATFHGKCRHITRVGEALCGRRPEGSRRRWDGFVAVHAG